GASAENIPQTAKPSENAMNDINKTLGLPGGSAVASTATTGFCTTSSYKKIHLLFAGYFNCRLTALAPKAAQNSRRFLERARRDNLQGFGRHVQEQRRMPDKVGQPRKSRARTDLRGGGGQQFMDELMKASGASKEGSAAEALAY